jgi:hypothetical protein
MKLLTEAQILKLYKDRKYLCFEPDLTRADMIADAQYEQDKAFHDREVERLTGLEQVHHRNELERIFKEIEHDHFRFCDYGDRCKHALTCKDGRFTRSCLWWQSFKEKELK